MGRLLNLIFTTNSAIWFEKDLTKKLVEYKPKISLEVDMNSTKDTIEWLKKQKQKWVVNSKEISVAKIYNHCWPSARFNGNIVGSIKIGFGHVFISDYDKIVKFPNDMAFIYDTYVSQDNRRKGVGKFLINQAVKYAKSEGYARIGCHIPPWNKASISAYKKNDFKKVDYIRNFRIFGVSFKISNSPKKLFVNNGGDFFYEQL